MNSGRRIARSTSDRMIGGVCGGLANYLGVDSTIVRIAFLLLVFAAGMSPLVYILLWVVLPSDTSTASNWTQQVQQNLGEIQDRAATVATQVTEQVQKVAGNNNPPAPPAGGDQGPSTGPTQRL